MITILGENISLASILNTIYRLDLGVSALLASLDRVDLAMRKF